MVLEKNSSILSYQIDLREVLPEWVMIGFSAGTGQSVESHTLHSWEFDSSLEREDPENFDYKSSKLMAILTISGGVLLVVVIVVIASLVMWRRKLKQRERTERTSLITKIKDLERRAGPKTFSYGALVLATNNFSEDRKLGAGGFGVVYRGYISDLDTTVAVKKISKGSKQGREEYITEVKIISWIRHRNLVQLIGWYHDKGEFLLVYEFMPNRSLDSHLFGTRKSPLTWDARYKIALGMASALLYLHEEWEQ